MKRLLKTRSKKLRPMLKVPVVDVSHPEAKSLSVYAVLIFAFLVLRSRMGSKCSETEISKKLRIDPSTVKRHLKVLVDLGLAASMDRGYVAKKPGGHVEDLFKAIKKPLTNTQWSDRLVYDTLFLPTRKAAKAGLSIYANMIYWRLVRWAAEVKPDHGVIAPGANSSVQRLTYTYLATAINCDRKTVSDAIESLRTLCLIRTPQSGGTSFGVALGPLTDDQKRYWRSRWEPAARAPSFEEYFPESAGLESAAEPVDPITQILESYSIHGSLQDELLLLVEYMDVSLAELQQLLKDLDKQNRGNRVVGKSKHQHPGYLLRHYLNERKQLDTTRNTFVMPEQPDWERSEVVKTLRRTLQLGNQAIGLLDQVVKKPHLPMSDGTSAPIDLRWSDVDEVYRESRGNFELFRDRIACKLVRIDSTKAGECPWLDQWRKVRPVPPPDYNQLQDLYRGGKDGKLFTTLMEELREWSLRTWIDETTAQANANTLVAKMVELWDKSNGKVDTDSYYTLREAAINCMPADWLTA